MITDQKGGANIEALSIPTIIDLVGDECADVWDDTNGNWVTDYKKCGDEGTLCKRQSEHVTDPDNGKFKDDCDDIPVVHTNATWSVDASACGSNADCWDTTVHGSIPQITKTCQGRTGNGLGCDGNAKGTPGFKANNVVETEDCPYTKTTHGGKCGINAVYGPWTGACPCATDTANPPRESRTCTDAKYGGDECTEEEQSRVCPNHDPDTIACGT